MSQFGNGWSPLPVQTTGGGAAAGGGATGGAPAVPSVPAGCALGADVAAGAPGPYWCYRVTSDGLVHVTAIPGSTLAGFNQVYAIGGPFTSVAEACGCGASAPPAAPQPPSSPAPVQPTSGGGGALPSGGTCPAAPCPIAPPVAPVDPAPFQAAEAPAALTSCLPGFAADLVTASAGKSLVEMLRSVGFVDQAGRQVWYDRAIASLQGSTGIWGDLGRGAANTLGWLIQQTVPGLQKVADVTAAATGCDKATAPLLIATQLVVGAWRRWVGEVPDPLTGALDYLTSYSCALGIPEQSALDEMRARRAIGLEQWRCMTKMHGNNPSYQRHVVANAYEWPSIEQVIGLERRQRLSAGEINHLWDRNRCPTKDQRDDFRAAAEYVPTPTEAAEWMGKDLGDPLLTQTFGLFNEFYQKYRGAVKQAFDFNGVPEQWARQIFGAHRKSAAPHQMYEMHKRLRPGWWGLMPGADALHMAQAIAPRRPAGEGGLLEQASNLQFLAQQREAGALYGSDPAAVARFGATVWVKPVVSPDPKIPVPSDLTGLPPQWLDEIGNNEEAARAYLAETVTTGFHVFEGLSQANYPPFWRARLLALSYNVMTRVDMRRAYETGQLNKAQLGEKLQDRGYTPVDSQYLANFYEVAATQLASRRPAVNAWVNDGYDMALLKQALLDQGMRPEMWPAVQKAAETRRKIYVQQRCIRHLKKLVLAGLVEDGAIAPRLTSIGLSGDEATRLASEWQCERRAVPKPESASTVCRYLKQNLIGPALAVRLIHRLGYTYPESRRIVNSCLLDPVPKGMKRRSDLAAATNAAIQNAPPGEGEQLPPLGAGAGGALGPGGVGFGPAPPQE